MSESRPEPPPAAPPEPAPGDRRSRTRLALAVVAGIIPLIPIVIALSLSNSGGGAAATAGSLYTPVARSPRTPARHPAGGRGTLVALVTHPTPMRSAPGGHAFARLGRRTAFGSPAALWVVRRAGAWLGVVSSLAGNGKLGWIAAADASLARVQWQLHVALAARRLSVLLDGHVVRRYRVAVGAAASPTPTGRFAVTDRLNTGDPSGPYGCCILALSAKAPHAIQGWNGGDRIAIHSTPETSTIGQAVSHGCVRLTLAEGRWLLAHIPLGTPTVIFS
jgi:hypothetical protein